MSQMKKTPSSKAPEPLTAEIALTGLLALMVDDRESRLADGYKPQKTVSLLHDAGLNVDQIAQIIGKNTPAVAKAIQRDKKTREGTLDA